MNIFPVLAVAQAASLILSVALTPGSFPTILPKEKLQPTASVTFMV